MFRYVVIKIKCLILLQARRGIKLVLCLSSPKFPSGFCCFVFDVSQLLKVKFIVYYVMTKMGANE